MGNIRKLGIKKRTERWRETGERARKERKRESERVS